MAIQLSGSLAITGSLVATSQIVAQTLNVQQVTSSIVYSSGSNIFGNSLSNTQQFTGSVSITGSLSVNGTSSTLGTGTTNYLPKFTGTNTIGNSIVSESGAALSVAGSIGISGNYPIILNSVSGVTSQQLQYQNNGTNKWQLYLDTSNNSFNFYSSANTANRLTLTEAGNLGLGITPSAWVDYTGFQIGTQGSIGATSTVINFGQNVYYGSSGNSYIANGNAAMYQMNDGVHGWRIAGSGTAGNAITFTQAMTLDASGRLGIGTTSPAYKLHIVTDAVAGRQNMSSISRTTGNWVRFTNPQYSADASMGLILRVFPDSDTRQGAGIIASGGSNNATTDLDLFVTTSPDGTGGTSYSALKINGLNGNVGIGTTSPSYKLDVTGTARTTDNTVLASSGNYVSIGGAPFYAGTSVGSLSIRGDLYPGIAFYTGSAGGDLVGQIFSYAGTGNMILNADPNNSNSSTTIQFYVDDSFKMLINASGNVGIGTTSPSSKLHVFDSTTAASTLVRGIDANLASSYMLQHGGGGSRTEVDGTWYMSYGSAQTDFGLTPNLGGGLVFWFTSGSTTTNPMTLKRSGNAVFTGNVGIGTTSPSYTLQVGKQTDGDNTDYAIAVSRHGTGASPGTWTNNPAITIQDQTNNGPASVDINGLFNISLGRFDYTDTNAANATLLSFTYDGTLGPMRVDGRGNTWIGYDRASAPTNSGAFSLLVRNGLTVGSSTQSTTPPSNGAIIEGNVGIGITSPQARLDVLSTLNVQATGNSDLPYINFSNNGRSFDWGRVGGLLQGDGDGALYFQTKLGGGLTEKMRITSSGTVQPGTNGTQDLGTSSLRWATVFTSDLSLSNGIGDYTIVEGENDLFLYNNKQNKVYKFVIEEVDPSIATPKKS